VKFRRGTAAFAMILVLVLLQLGIVVIVLTTARDVDTSQQRLDSTRAFYGAESGTNMALREVMVGVDEDGDGTVGSISNDGNANNDPTIGLAKTSASRTLSGAGTDIISVGRAGNARRKADAQVQGLIGGLPQTEMLAWAKAGSSVPKYAVWNSLTSAWGAAQNMPTMDGEAKWIRTKLSPTRNETTFIQEDLNKHVDVCFFNNGAWGTMTQLSSDTGGLNDRPEDIAYEQVSGDALCMYWKGTISQFGYRIYNGTTFSSEQLVSNPFSTECDFLTLVPRYGSDEIFALAADGNAGGPLVAAYWNGTSFTSWTTMVASLESNNEECYALGYEAQTNKAMAVYIETNVQTPRYKTWNGTTWSAQGSLPTIGNVGHWVRLAPDPTSNTIICGVLDDSNALSVNVWNGTAWASNQTIESDCGGYDGRYFDVVFERGTGHALIVYAENGQNTPRYRTWNGTTWSSQQSCSGIGAQTKLVQLSRGFTNGEVFIAISDASSHLHMQHWSGAAVSADTTVETTLGGWMKYNSFAVPEPSIAPHPRVLGWTEVKPQ
jgi:adhesin/invasin